MFFISPLQAYSFRCWFPTYPFDPSPKDAFSNSFVSEVGIFFSILFFQLSIFYFFLPEALWCCSFQPIISFCQTSCSFHAYPFNRSVVPFCSSSFNFIKFLPSVSTGVLSEFVLPWNSSLPECFQLCSTSLHSFFQFVQTFQGSLGSLIGQRSNLVLPILFSLPFFPPVPF